MTIVEELIAEHTAKTQDVLKLRARADKLAAQMAEAQREASDAEARVQRVEKEIINALREKALGTARELDARADPKLNELWQANKPEPGLDYPQGISTCKECHRPKGCNADCEDMNCEHCYCNREGRDG